MKMLVVIGILTLSSCGLEKDPNAREINTPAGLQNCSVTSVQDGNRVFTCPKVPTCTVTVTNSGVIVASSC